MVKVCMVKLTKRKQYKWYEQQELRELHEKQQQQKLEGLQELHKQQEQQESKKRPEFQEPLGSGDVKLIGACCLYLSFGRLPMFLLVVTAGSLCLALYFLVRYKDKTFPFAPAIVLGSLVAFMT